jgi:hypothetical protein
MDTVVNNCSRCVQDREALHSILMEINDHFVHSSAFGFKCCLNRVYEKIAKGELYWCECAEFTPAHLTTLKDAKTILLSNTPHTVFFPDITKAWPTHQRHGVDTPLNGSFPTWVTLSPTPKAE